MLNIYAHDWNHSATIKNLLPSVWSCYIWGKVEGEIDRGAVSLKSILKSPQFLFTWILPQHRVTQSGCPVSSIPPPGRRSGASGAGCRSPPQTRHPSRPEGLWASWRSPWPLREENNGQQSQMMSQILTGKSSGWSLYPSYCEAMQWDFSKLGHQL